MASMVDEGGKDKALTQRVLENALAYRDNSAVVYHEAVNQIKDLTSNDDFLYPPAHFPNVRDQFPESSVRTFPDSDFDGRLAQAEAVAVVVLLDECSALSQSFAKDWETTRKMYEVLKIERGQWQHDVVGGIAEFGNMISMAAGVRERILAGDGRPEGRTIGDSVKKSWWDKFEKPIHQDKMTIGENTAKAITKIVSELAGERIPNNPEAAKNEDEIKARIKSRKHGARLAEKLYLECRELASKDLPSRIEPKKVN